MSLLGTLSATEVEEHATAFRAGPGDEGARLDSWLAARMPPHVSRSRVKALILAGRVWIEGKPCEVPNRRLKLDEEIVLEIPEPEDAQPEPEDIPLEILFEDDELVVLNKPAGLVVHPAPGNWTGTLVNALIHHCGDSLRGIGGVRRPGIVHRLDKDTSGVMVVAKSELAHASLAAQFADHGRNGPLERAYLAMVWGAPERMRTTVDAPLGRSSSNRAKRAVVRPEAHDAREAITHVEVVERYGLREDATSDASLLVCHLETGRTHQIRVHMSHIGHPLIGDKEYGSHFATKANTLAEPARSAVREFPRQALHASVLGFAHPVSGETLRFEAPLPADMTALISAFESLG